MIHSALPQVAQRVIDLDRAVRFYCEVLGLRLITRFDPPGLAFFDLGATRLLLGTDHYPSSLFLEVDDMATAHHHLESRGVVFEHTPRLIFTDQAGDFGTPGTEEHMAFFWDSEGNLVGLMERQVPASAGS